MLPEAVAAILGAGRARTPLTVPRTFGRASIAMSEPPPSSAPAPAARAQGPRTRLSPLDLRVALLGVAGFLIAISWQFVLPILPVRLSRIGYSAAQIGTLVSLLSLAMGIVELEIGRIAGVLGARRTLVTGLVVNAAAMAWIVLTRAPAGVAAGLIGVGMARAAMWSPLHAAVAATASEETRGRAFSVFWFLTSVAFLAGPAIGGTVAAQFGIRMSFFVGAAVSLLTLAVVVPITEPRPAVVQAGPPAASWEVLSDPIVRRLCLANHFFYAISGIWSTFVPLYMVHLKLSVATIGWLFTVQGLTYALVQLPTGRLADRVGPERLILPGVIGRAAILAICPLLHGAAPLLVAAVGFGAAGGMIPVTFTMLIARFSSREHYTSAMGVYNSSGDLGFFVGPFLGGAAALLGIVAPFVLAFPLGALGVAMALRGIAAVRRADREV